MPSNPERCCLGGCCHWAKAGSKPKYQVLDLLGQKHSRDQQCEYCGGGSFRWHISYYSKPGSPMLKSAEG